MHLEEPNESSSQFSGMFEVDRSSVRSQQNNTQRLDNLFSRDKQILPPADKKIVIYGTFQQQPRGMYDILLPYLNTAASVTSSAAVSAGKGIYAALSHGIWWCYDKLRNSIVPYSMEQIPKLLAVVTKGAKTEGILGLGSFNVVEVDPDDFDRLQQASRNSSHKNKKRVIIEMGEKTDPEFAKFLENQNFQMGSSEFPIDEEESVEVMIIPSGQFRVSYNEAIEKVIRQKSGAFNLESPAHQISEVESYKKVPKQLTRIPQGFVIDFEDKDEIEYEILDNITRNEDTYNAYILPVRPRASIQSDGSEDPSSGEAPLLTDEKPGHEGRVRVQIHATPVHYVQRKEEKVEEKQVQYA